MLSDTLNQQLKKFAGEGNEPLAVAFSGGGDSTALLHLLINAVGRQEREIHALIVDHKLRRGSGVEAKLAADRAKDMGARPKILKWIHDNPNTGVQEKARNARYGLMGDACRRLGAKKLFVGHNLGDQAETVLMRQRKESGWRGLAGIQTSIRAPIWPQLRGIDVIRPLLNETREDLRTYNQSSGLEFVDDPTNEHLGYERIRTRQELQKDPLLVISTMEVHEKAQVKLVDENARIQEFLTTYVEIFDWGGAWLKPSGLAQNQDETLEALRMLIPCISGSNGFPPRDRLHQHIRSLKAGFTAGTTLGGARLLSREKGLLLVRDAGMVLGRHQRPPLAPLKLKPNQSEIWDGRILIETTQPDILVCALGAIEQRPDKETKKALKAIPLSARKTIPVFCAGNEKVNLPFIEMNADFKVKSLISERLNGFLSPS